MLNKIKSLNEFETIDFLTKIQKENIVDKNYPHENRYGYTGVGDIMFLKKALDIINDISYYLYDLGCGIPIIPLYSHIRGYNSIGYEIDENLIKKSEYLGLSNFIENQDIIKIDFDKLNKKKILYFNQPIYYEHIMLKYLRKMINNLNADDILIGGFVKKNTVLTLKLDKKIEVIVDDGQHFIVIKKIINIF
jgi:hypothetical protein